MGQVEDAYRDCVKELCRTVLGTRIATSRKGVRRRVPSISDSGNKLSVEIGNELLSLLGTTASSGPTATA